MFFAINDEVMFVPSDDKFKKYAGKVEICGVSMKAPDPVYLIMTKDKAYLRVKSDELEEIKVARSTTRKRG